jgi:hypothetical protein
MYALELLAMSMCQDLDSACGLNILMSLKSHPHFLWKSLCRTKEQNAKFLSHIQIYDSFVKLS